MIRSAVTVSLVEEARGGPFVFWNGLEHAFQRAAELGFDAVEVFAPGPLNGQLEKLSSTYGLSVAAVGTGAGMVKHGLSLTAPEPLQRQAARDFVKQMIDFGGQHQAPAIIGSMQGRWGGALTRDVALKLLVEALNDLGTYAQQYQLPLIYEPLNRYETNLIRTMAEGVALLESLGVSNVKLLADLFHMNIEEANVARAIRAAGPHIGHVHFVDSNRQAAGFGHTNFLPIAEALREISYAGYMSAESFALPDSETAARQTIEVFNQLFR
jgi:sugar phosphate isomerase/epimerase